MVFGALREKSIDVSVGGCLKQNMASTELGRYKTEKEREKVSVGP